jgi:drug/metabolite transporter (DMT)-like permease
VLVVVAASVSWAFGAFYSPRTALPSDALASTAWQMLFGGAGMLTVGLVAGEAGDVHASAFSADSLIAFVYLISAGSLLAFTAFVWLLQNAPVSTVMTYAYVNPVVAVFLGWAILSEEITATVVIGTVAIVFSVATVVRRESSVGPGRVAGRRPAHDLQRQQRALSASGGDVDS